LFTALKALYANATGMSYFNKKKGQWFLTAEDAAKWKPGPCVVWEITGQCPEGDKCTCAHLDREALNKKNKRNKLGNYVEATLPARCNYVLKKIKKRGAWSFMKGLVRADAPCLVELLKVLPEQPGGEIDVDTVQSFIAANKVGAKPQVSKTELAAITIQKWWRQQNELNQLTPDEENFMQECSDEQQEFENFMEECENEAEAEKAEAYRLMEDEEERQQAFLWACEVLADWNEKLQLQNVNAELERLRAEEQNLKEVCAQEEAAKRAAMNYVAATKRNAVVVSSPLAPRDIGALLGTKPAPVAPAVRGVPQIGSLKDLEDYYKLGMNHSWSEICGY
jgi:hypothetical protein